MKWGNNMTTNKEAKTLYFEGAGMDFEPHEFSDIGNYRIRTAFTNLDGEKFYLEMGRGAIHGHKGKSKKLTIISEWGLYAPHVFKITGDNDDENKNHISTDWKHTRDNYQYTKKDITEWVNKNLNCDFDTIQVLDFFYGYRVHADNRGYNFMETIDLNHERAIKRKEAYNAIDTEYRTLLNEKYSKIGLLEMDDEGITIRCHASDEALGDIPRVKRIPIM